MNGMRSFQYYFRKRTKENRHAVRRGGVDEGQKLPQKIQKTILPLSTFFFLNVCLYLGAKNKKIILHDIPNDRHLYRIITMH